MKLFRWGSTHVTLALLALTTMQAHAVEATFGLYGLGSGAVGAGQLPPSGFYYTSAISAVKLENSATVPFGGLTIRLKAKIAPASVSNFLFVAPDEILGGRLALSATSGFALSTLDASIISGATVNRSAQGWGAMDTTISAALGWQVSPEFSHKVTLSQWIPTGRYETGFFPIVGLNRAGTDFSWGATYMEAKSKIEVSATVGVTREGYNPATDYLSGVAMHFEESVSKHFESGFRAGLYSYQYQQITGDSGAHAALGPFKTRAIALGPTFGYTTLVDGHILSFTLQGAHEFAVANRLRATTGLLSMTYKF